MGNLRFLFLTLKILSFYLAFLILMKIITYWAYKQVLGDVLRKVNSGP